VAHFVSPFPPEQPERGLYRPLTAFSYAVDRALWGPGPKGFHIVNLIYYLFTVLFVWLITETCLGSTRAALLTALLFAFHPVHCEVVDSVAGRSDLLSLLFSLIAVYSFTRYLRSGAKAGWYFVLSVVATAGSMLAKEIGVLTPFLLLAYLLFVAPAKAEGKPQRSSEPARSFTKPFLCLWPFFALIPVYLILRVSALGGRFGPDVTILESASLSNTIYTIGRIFFEYIRLIFVPVTLNIDAFYERTIGVQQGPSPQAFVGLIVLLSTILLLIILMYRLFRERRSPIVSNRSKRKLPSHTRFPDHGVMIWALCFFLLYLFPVSHIIPFGALMAERFLFAPSFGLILFLIAGLRRPVTAMIRSRFLLTVSGAALLILICGLLGIRSYTRSSEWYDPVTLWIPVEREIKDDYRVYNNLAIGYIGRGNSGEAIRMLQRSIGIKPDHVPALNNLGYIHLKEGRYDEAEQVFLALTRTRPRYYYAWNSLGAIEVRRGNLEKALQYFRQALAINPNYLSARRNIMRINQTLKRHQ